jgi:hypothetical protein
MAQSPILGGFATPRAPLAAANDAVNVAVEIIDTKDGFVPGFLFLTSGLDLVTTVGTGPIRGVLPLNGILYLVTGAEVYSLTPTGVSTFLGVVSSATTPVSMFHNTTQLMIVDGVGGWLVPGGYPLTGGTIEDGGGLYAIGDQITLEAATGTQTVYPTLQVTAIVNNAVDTYLLPNAGTTYTTATGVATTPIQPQPGSGTGFTINITSSTGPITTATLDAGGVDYVVGDTGIVATDSNDAVYWVTAVSGGVVTTFMLLNRGTGYSTGTDIPTQAGQGIAVNLGTGLTFDVTASSGPITASSIDGAGTGFLIGNAGLIGGGTDDATYLVTAVGETGQVSAFEIITPGAAGGQPAEFTQKSTTGSGQGFVLEDPTFGSFLGLVPITLPFGNPIVGGISDGFGLLVFSGSQYLAQSDELDLSTWEPLNYGVADQSPDNCVSLAVIHDEVFVLKTYNTEVWVDEGNPDFAFGPLISVHIEQGIAAPFSVAVANEDLIWLSQNDQGQGVVVAATGYQTRPISSQAVTNEIQSYANIGDAIAYVRQEGGHTYYVLTFPEANATWVYDQTSSALLNSPIWHKLAALDNGALNRHWGNCFTPWTMSGGLSTVVSTFDPLAVTMQGNTVLETATGLVGLPLSYAAFLFSVWLYIPDSVGVGVIFGNQQAGKEPGVEIAIQNNTNGSPQISITLYDATSTAILAATYDFTSWSAWMNLMISVDTAIQQIQVFANTLGAGGLAESELSSSSLTWTSSNPIGTVATVPWSLTVET